MDNMDKNTAEQEIDLIELAKKLWENRIFILKVCGIALIVGLVVAFSLPKEYTTTIVLVPEVNSPSGSGVGALMAIAGIDLNQNAGRDFFSPDLYPEVMKSTPFLMGLFDVQVQDTERKINTSLFTYLKEGQKKVWWSYILNAPFNLLGLFSSKGNNDNFDKDPDDRIIALSEQQKAILENLQNRIAISVNRKAGVVTLSSTMQSPVISAFIVDTITTYMQKYIIDYRTQKARQDLAFTEQLYNESQENYYIAQKNLSTYMDENMGIVSARYRNTQERLQNEANLTFGVYNQMAQQLQMARMKVQDTTPVYLIIQPAVVPLNPSSPRKAMTLIAFVFFVGIGACGWIFMKDFLRKQIKN